MSKDNEETISHIFLGGYRYFLSGCVAKRLIWESRSIRNGF
jgi:hypothetical protein